MLTSETCDDMTNKVDTEIKCEFEITTDGEYYAYPVSESEIRTKIPNIMEESKIVAMIMAIMVAILILWISVLLIRIITWMAIMLY